MLSIIRSNDERSNENKRMYKNHSSHVSRWRTVNRNTTWWPLGLQLGFVEGRTVFQLVWLQ